MADLMALIRNSPWLLGIAALVGVAFVGALLWKILRSNEGFLFGYGNWIVGKWQATPPAPNRPAQEPTPPGARPAQQEPKRDFSSLKRAYHLQNSVLTLSRMLDGDLAYLMMHDAGDWEPKIFKALQTLVSGVTRVVHPAGKCRCGFFILDDSERYLELVVGEGFQGLTRPRLAVDRSCAGRAFLTGEDYYCRDVTTDPVYWQSSRGSRDYRSIACVPVRAGQAVFGVLCLDAEQPDAFTTEDFAHLEVFAAKLAVFCSFHALQVGVCSVDSGKP
ncbi:MAG TPA: GAF domain-containing protein [Symbiobacteriaceae bacterium]|nr:GAF domain-containing protein [Symbiobacteriaceae bacterium]